VCQDVLDRFILLQGMQGNKWLDVQRNEQVKVEKIPHWTNSTRPPDWEPTQ